MRFQVGRDSHRRVFSVDGFKMIEYPTYNMIHLGQFADIDPDERSFASEKATRIFAGKSFGSAEDPLYGKLTAVTMQDDNGDGHTERNTIVSGGDI